MKPKPIPKFETLNVECGVYLKVHQSQKLWDLGQTKAPVGTFTIKKQNVHVGKHTIQGSYGIEQKS